MSTNKKISFVEITKKIDGHNGKDLEIDLPLLENDYKYIFASYLNNEAFKTYRYPGLIYKKDPFFKIIYIPSEFVLPLPVKEENGLNIDISIDNDNNKILINSNCELSNFEKVYIILAKIPKKE